MIKNCFEYKVVDDFSLKIKQNGCIIYGAGKRCVSFLSSILDGEFKGLHISDIKIIVDRDHAKTGKTVFGIPICNLETLKELSVDTSVIITPYELAYQIITFLSDEFHFVNYFIPNEKIASWMNCIFDYKSAIPIKEISEKKIAGARLLFEDKQSLCVYDAVIEYRRTGNPDAVRAVYDKRCEQYFPVDIIEFGKDEVFVDCGVYDGQTSIAFARKAENFLHIYGIELDNRCLSLIDLFLPENVRPKFELFEVALGDVCGEVVGEMQILQNSKIIFEKQKPLTIPIDNCTYKKIKMETLDALLLNNLYTPTYIKMDIEGSEISALNGSKNIIQKYKPKLAISVYHNFSDIWEIPLLIHNLVPEYKLFLRQHAIYPSETVVYAIKNPD